MSGGWIGVDLDGTLAFYDGWRGVEHIGAPIPAMVDRVEQWLAEGKKVKIFTARVSRGGPELAIARAAINAWSRLVFGHTLEVTCEKDFQMTTLYDDRCVAVEFNTGRLLS